ncbi:MAG: GAF domain-containing protein, partial [Deinococcus sp.]
MTSAASDSLPVQDRPPGRWHGLPARLAEAQTASAFAGLLAGALLEEGRAHGVRVCLLGAAPEAVPEPLCELGRGLTLCDPALGRLAAGQGGRAAQGMHQALLAGPLLLDVLGGDSLALDSLEPLCPLLGLAFEGVQAREARRGSGREQETLTRLLRRMGGSLDLPSLLTATAETAAQALGFERAFVGLLSAPQPADGQPGDGQAGRSGDGLGERTADVFTHGFAAEFVGGVGVGPESYERLFRRGEAIVYQRARDHDSPMGAGLAELAPETAVIAPLMARGRPLGVLYSDSARAASLGEDDLWLVLALAEQASLSIDNARLYAEETRKREAAEAMREVGEQLSQSLKLGETYSAVLERAAGLFGADACAVYEVQPVGRSLTIRSALGLSSEEVLRSSLRPGAGVVGRAVARAETVWVRDLSAEPGLAGGNRHTRELLAQGRYPYRGGVGLPLSVRGRVVGGLALYFHAPLPLGRDELALAGVFASQAALAIENARLYEEEVRREREAAALLGVVRLQQ